MDRIIRVRNCLPPCSQGSPMNVGYSTKISACMVPSKWTSPSGCSESSKCIAPMHTLHDFYRMAIIYLCDVQGKTLSRLCDIRLDVPLRV
ncbi:hypothetical protein M405DRAFT_815874 [Rhizopogon salebrosus TDB-379]|nr:hypothetical protein M405DRAFT_815874 [Rhizopogon salebrosus TDB-379]